MSSTIEPIDEPSNVLKKKNPEIKQPNRLWLLAFSLSLIFDFLFWKHRVGINFAIFSGLYMLGGLSLLVTEGYHPSHNSLWLLIPFTFFVVVTFLRQETLTRFLAFAFTIFAVGVFANTCIGGRRNY